MRSLPEVITQMQALIPPNTGDLSIRLKSVQESARYAPPEMQGYWWTVAQQALIECKPEEPAPEWWGRVLAVWRGER